MPTDTPDTTDDRAGGSAEAARPARKPSLFLINTGDGKGKSSSAFGVMLRGWARGWKVAVVQCIKSGDWNTGEQKAAAELGIEWHAMGDGFTWDSDNMDETARLGRLAWERARDLLASGDYDLVVVDELTYLMSFGWVTVDEVVAGIRERAPKTNVIITGRDAPPELIEIADTVTEMRKVKHAFDQGIVAKKGIEY
jgi:cob(I)alamin adenosyltransferase